MNRIKQIRKNLSISIRELSNESGLSIKKIKKLEKHPNEVMKLRVWDAYNLATALGVTNISELFDEY